MKYSEVLPYAFSRPFRPFYVAMADGRRYEVRHPEMILVGRSSCAVFDEATIWHQLDLRLMTAVGPLEPTTAG